jgi:hypothetical protein
MSNRNAEADRADVVRAVECAKAMGSIGDPMMAIGVIAVFFRKQRDELLKPFEELARAFKERANEKSYNFHTADELFIPIAKARQP